MTSCCWSVDSPSRRLPEGFSATGCRDERGAIRSAAAFSRHRFTPEVALRDVARLWDAADDQSAEGTSPRPAWPAEEETSIGTYELHHFIKL
jgi:hypothetical protein